MCIRDSYRGELLPACYDEWIAGESDGLRSQLIIALNERANQAQQRGDLQDAAHFSSQAMELEPASEAAALSLMQACIAMDDRTGALRAYHRHAEALASELEAAPGPRVEAQHREIRQDIKPGADGDENGPLPDSCLLYTSPSPRDATLSRMPSSA